MRPLESFQFNKFSQNGEDGIIQELLNRISLQTSLNRWCCEFGAWDGVHLSNTARLILEDDFKAVLIEGDPARIRDLQKNFPGDSVTKICSFVTPTGVTSIENILSRTMIPLDFDFLSVDIDGMDYWILESLRKYKPKVICIEFNPSIPNVVHFVQQFDPDIKQGSSAKAISDLGKMMGYSVVSATYCNLLLVRNEFINAVVETLPTLEELVPNGNDPQFIFCGYDGEVLSNKPTIDLIWHGKFPIKALQILPKNLRSFRGNYTITKKLTFLVFYFLRGEKDSKPLIRELLSKLKIFPKKF